MRPPPRLSRPERSLGVLLLNETADGESVGFPGKHTVGPQLLHVDVYFGSIFGAGILPSDESVASLECGRQSVGSAFG